MFAVLLLLLFLLTNFSFAAAESDLPAKCSEKKEPPSGDAAAGGAKKESPGDSKSKKSVHSKFTMCDCKYTVKSNATFTFGGERRAYNGTVIGPSRAPRMFPVITTEMKEAVSEGLLCAIEVSAYTDHACNKRLSLHAVAAKGALQKDFYGRKSERDETLFILNLLFRINSRTWH